MGERILHNIMPLLKLILFVFFIFLCLLPFGMIVQLDFLPLPENALITDIVVEGGLVLVVFGALLMMFKVFPAIYFEDVFVHQQNSIIGFLKGSLIGLALIFICTGILLAFGNVQLTLGGISFTLFFGYIIFFLLVAVFEELMFRTIPLFVFAERYPIIVTILINGLLFGFVHMGNPGFTWVAMINITLAGALFSIFTLLKKNISWAIGIHFGWNFTQGILMGYKVSGTNSPGVLTAKPIGEPYISGGVFGIEGSFICTIVLLILIVWLLTRNKIEPIPTLNNGYNVDETTI
ncbi:MAG: CPBP family intramembrane metalloprotease [Pedobacter sp.]|nr:MAG: CPBP family intramembrane metalloprotease [Pedobacter sp.]